MPVSNSFVDIDLSQPPPGLGAGLIPQTKDEVARLFGRDMPSFEKAFPQHMVPRSQWRDRVERTARQYRGTVTKIYNQGQEGSCFPAGTRIRMADGTQKPIEQMRLLDTVLTAEGNVGLVTMLFAKEAKELVTVDLWGHKHLRATGEHPVLTKRGYVKASELIAGDFVRVPKYAPQKCTAVITSNHVHAGRVYVEPRQVRSKRSGSVQGRATATIVESEFPDVISLTPEFGRVIGLFLAEGCTGKNRVTWTFGGHERTTLVDELCGLLKQLGASPRIQVRNARASVVKVHIDSKQWAELFESLCSTGSGAKRMHADITSGPMEFLEGVLSGWLDGDGYDRRGMRQGVTVSHDLALNMFDIANALGKCPAISTCQPKVSHNVKFRRRRWDVTMAEETGKDAHCREQDELATWRKVREVRTESFTGYVYNFEVAGDNSYVAESIGVHNCVGFGSAQMLETTLRRRYGIAHWVSLSGMSVYKRIGSSAQSGAMISDGMDAVMEGALPADTMENRAKYQHVHPYTGFSKKLPNGWRDTAKLFHGTSFAIAEGPDAVASALLNGFLGILGRQSHCIPYAYLDTFDNGGGFCAAYPNSWGDWGDEGFGYDSERIFGNVSLYVLLDVVTRPDLKLPAI